MKDQINRTHTTSSEVSMTSGAPQAASSTARKIGSWVHYAVFGFWLRLVVAVALIGCGLALLATFPIAVLQRTEVISTHVLYLGSWLERQSTGFYYLVAGLGSGIGAFLLYLAFGPARRWLLHRPGA